MKRFLLLICSILLAMNGCNKFDPSDMWDKLSSIEQRVQAMEELCIMMNTNIEALESLVSAIDNQDYIKSVVPVLSQDEVIGYTITFAKGKSVTLYHGEDGEDGFTPTIGVKKDVDGMYYWTLEGEWLLDEMGQKILAQGRGGNGGQVARIPKLKVENDKWYISYDEGSKWIELGSAIGPQGSTGPQGTTGDPMFQSVVQTATTVVFTLKDGTKITVPKTPQDPGQNLGQCPVTLSFIGASEVSAEFEGVLSDKSIDLKVTLYYSDDKDLNIYRNDGKVECTEFANDKFSLVLSDLMRGTKYYYFYEVCYNGCLFYSEKSSFTTSSSASVFYEPANCYIVSTSGKYQFKALKGNSMQSVGEVASVEVLWETFGNDVQPSPGDLISSVSFEAGSVYFDTNPEYKVGNALIAAKDAAGQILWSWHIWFTDKPLDHVYNNDAGIVMDRNLGATSATPGDVGALGLLYQWGRKDPFLNASVITFGYDSEGMPAKSTLSPWPKPVSSVASVGTIEYTIANPTTFITARIADNGDWYYTGTKLTDNTRWQSVKTIYDPCPAGYRVPDGGENGLWAKAFGRTENFPGTACDDSKSGSDFGPLGTGKYYLTSDSSICWYPNTGSRPNYDGELYNVGDDGGYWSVTADASTYNYAHRLYLGDSRGNVFPAASYYRATGYSVRCVRE